MFTGAVHIISENCKCVKLIDLPSDSEEPNSIVTKKKMSQIYMQFAPVNISMKGIRRLTPNFRRGISRRQEAKHSFRFTSEIKDLVRTLVAQAMLDTNRTVLSMRKLRDNMKKNPDYKIGFITSFIRKERQQLNDFFEMALKFKDHVKVLQQMKVFEYIMRSNVNITTLVRQVIHLHIQKRESLKTTSEVPAELEVLEHTETAIPTAPHVYTEYATPPEIEEGPTETRQTMPSFLKFFI